MMYYVYVLKSQRDEKLYIGSTNDLQRRFDEHRQGSVFATKYRLPVSLVYYEAYLHEWCARKREKQLKYFGKAYQELKKRCGLDKVRGLTNSHNKDLKARKS
ncbi:MAG: GIY-YIG nuclease family protein [Patescibacteria group bacterium]|nr:GIY-YIG nuclease family protein [Patescibacteria group bacterium]